MNTSKNSQMYTYVVRRGAETPPTKSSDPVKTLVLALLAILLVISMILPGRIQLDFLATSPETQGYTAPATR